MEIQGKHISRVTENSTTIQKKIYSIYKLMMWELLFHLHVFLHLLRTQEEFWADLVGQPDK